jgi:hypothetical protein
LGISGWAIDPVCGILSAFEPREDRMDRLIAILGLAIHSALPAGAETLLSEARGTWAGVGQGASFLARLTQEEDMARLRIWTGPADTPPTGEGTPEFDNAQIALSAFATLQALEVVETEEGTALQLVTEFTDEYAEGRVVLQLQKTEIRYAVLQYHYSEVAHDQGDGPVPYECKVDFVAGSVTEDGMEFSLSVDDGATDAATWLFSTAFDRSICSVG